MVRSQLCIFLVCLLPFRGNSAGYLNNPDSCASAVDLSIFFTAATGVVQTTDTYDNTNAAAEAGEPVPPCFAETGTDAAVNNSLWFTFTADGGLFHIETVRCNAGAQYITGGDTQMAVFQGNHCDSLVLTGCNEDLYVDNNPNTDFRAGLDIQTVAGQTYYLMIDGYASGGVAASGLFCIEITRIESVTCEQAAAGTFQIANNGFLCKGDNLLNALTFDAASFVIPVNQPLAGMSWALTAQPIPDGVWPGNIPGIISTPLSTQVLPVSLQNNIPSSVPLVYYFTPVVVGGAVLINPNADAKLPNLDVAAGCFELGETQVLTLVPVLEALEGIAVATPATAGQNNGSVHLQLEGGYPATVNNPDLYRFVWNTGDTTAYLNNLGAGTYTVTISDPSGCTDDLVLTAQVVVSANEQSLVTNLRIHPNPARADFRMYLHLQRSVALEIEIVDALGQTMDRFEAGNRDFLEQEFNLSGYSGGVYFVRVLADGQSLIRRIVVQP